MLGKRIRELRKSKGLSQAELAKAVGVSSSAIGMYEQERREPDSAKLEKFCELFGVTMDYLMGRSELRSYTPENEDIVETFDRMASDIIHHGGLMFNGVPMEADEVERVVDAMRLGMLLRLQQGEKKN